MNRIVYYIRYLLRIRHSWGFGVQSPAAYHFVRHVICQTSPYYAYEHLRNGNKKAGADFMKCKKSMLYFRVSNYAQPKICVNLLNDYDDAIKYGCNKVKFCNDISSQDTVDLFLGDISSLDTCDIDQLMLKVQRKSVFVIEDIHRDKESLELWRKLISCSKVSLSFDLYYLGIIFFDSTQTKDNYIVNF